MVKVFKFGFEYKGFMYGWHNGELYRLPSRSGNRYYPSKKLNPIEYGAGIGYRLKRDKIGMNKLKEMTVAIQPIMISKTIHPDCPF